MNSSLITQFIKVLVWDKGTIKFSIGVIVGLGFSISVILSTVGLMDGFTKELSKHLTRSEGQFSIYSRHGFFEVDEEVKQILQENRISQYAPVTQTQGVVVHNEVSKGVLIRGVEENSFSKITGVKVRFSSKNEVAIGAELAKQLDLKKGDEIALSFAYGSSQVDGLPTIKRVKVSDIVKHGVYEKDLRFIYTPIAYTQEVLDVDQFVNIIVANIPGGKEASQDDIAKVVNNLDTALPINLSVKPYWKEFGTLLEAVEIEKVVITLILQIVVVVSIFNVLALIFFLNEKKSKEIFLFNALGMSKGILASAWIALALISWALSCGMSLFFTNIFDFGLGNLDFLQLPGEIYHMGRISLALDQNDYSIVFGGTLLWMMIMVGFTLYRLLRYTPIQGLRKEFS